MISDPEPALFQQGTEVASALRLLARWIDGIHAHDLLAEFDRVRPHRHIVILLAFSKVRGTYFGVPAHVTRKLAHVLHQPREGFAHARQMRLGMAAAYTSTGRKTKVVFMRRCNLTRESSYGRSP